MLCRWQIFHVSCFRWILFFILCWLLESFKLKLGFKKCVGWNVGFKFWTIIVHSYHLNVFGLLFLILFSRNEGHSVSEQWKRFVNTMQQKQEKMKQPKLAPTINHELVPVQKGPHAFFSAHLFPRPRCIIWQGNSHSSGNSVLQQTMFPPWKCIRCVGIWATSLPLVLLCPLDNVLKPQNFTLFPFLVVFFGDLLRTKSIKR